MFHLPLSPPAAVLIVVVGSVVVAALLVRAWLWWRVWSDLRDRRRHPGRVESFPLRRRVP